MQKFTCDWAEQRWKSTLMGGLLCPLFSSNSFLTVALVFFYLKFMRLTPHFGRLQEQNTLDHDKQEKLALLQWCLPSEWRYNASGFMQPGCKEKVFGILMVSKKKVTSDLIIISILHQNIKPMYSPVHTVCFSCKMVFALNELTS